jgi:hypothetical protein
VISLAALKLALSDVAGIETLTETVIGGRRVYGFNGLIAAVDLNADAAAVESAIRNASAMRPTAFTASTFSTELGPAPAPAAQPKGKPMTTPAPGSFAASIRAMMDEARAGVAQARTDGLAKVGEAVGKLHEAKTATVQVAGSMAKTIEDEAASVMAELGQISNSLGGENG